MASIRKDIKVAASVEHAWAAVRDFGAVHQRLAPGFVVDAKLDGDSRIVTFGNGMVARERLVTLDDAARRLVYAVTGGRFTHDNASVEVIADGSGCRLIWQRNMLPDELAGPIAGMMEQACAVMKQALERD